MLNVLLKRRNMQPETAVILRQLASMISAGITITRSFDMLEQTQHDTDARAGLFKIKNHLLSGHSLFESLQIKPDWFDHFTCSLIHLGEQTGKLAHVLQILAADHENKLEFRRSIRRALFYPTVIFTVAIILTCCMLIFVIPAFASLFSGINKPLPLLTRMIFTLSSLLNHTLPIIFSLAIISLIALKLTSRNIFKILLHRLSILPPLAGILQSLALIRLLRNLALALSSGVPILDALQLISGITGHEVVNSSARQLRSSLCAGHTLYQAMQTLPAFPILAKQMVKAGEESGTLDKMLYKSAELLEMQLNSSIFHLTQLLEPLIMSVLGVLIGGLVIGMYLPVFNLGSAL